VRLAAAKGIHLRRRLRTVPSLFILPQVAHHIQGLENRRCTPPSSASYSNNGLSQPSRLVVLGVRRSHLIQPLARFAAQSETQAQWKTRAIRRKVDVPEQLRQTLALSVEGKEQRHLFQRRIPNRPTDTYSVMASNNARLVSSRRSNVNMKSQSDSRKRICEQRSTNCKDNKCRVTAFLLR
jgi:hypothetical protein